MNALAYAAAIAALPPMVVVPGWLWLRRLGISPLIALHAGFGATAAVAGGVVAVGTLLLLTVASAGGRERVYRAAARLSAAAIALVVPWLYSRAR